MADVYRVKPVVENDLRKKYLKSLLKARIFTIYLMMTIDDEFFIAHNKLKSLKKPQPLQGWDMCN
jgi:hypothetical protein